MAKRTTNPKSKARYKSFVDLADDDFIENQFGESNNNSNEEKPSLSFSLSELKNKNVVNQPNVNIVDNTNNVVPQQEIKEVTGQVVETTTTISNQEVIQEQPATTVQNATVSNVEQETVIQNNEVKNVEQQQPVIEKNVVTSSVQPLQESITPTQPSLVQNPQPNEVINQPLDEEENKNFDEKIEIKTEVKETPKKVYEVNYDDILNPQKVEKTKTIEDLFEKKDPIKELFSQNNQSQNLESGENNLESSEKKYSNLKPRSTVRTYNEAIKNQEVNTETNHFEENKIKQFLNVREKLEVKTNIYLKNSIVIKLKELEERTNESRSSIINKLIEIALKNIEE